MNIKNKWQMIMDLNQRIYIYIDTAHSAITPTCRGANSSKLELAISVFNEPQCTSKFTFIPIWFHLEYGFR